MRRRARFLSAAAGATVLLTVVLYAASPEDGHAAFQRREDTMKHLGIGRVVKGTAAYGPDAVTAAVTVASLRQHPRQDLGSARFRRRGEQDQTGDLFCQRSR
jgi:hypothetical protein